MTEKYPRETEFLLYQAEDGRINIEIRMQDETVWLTINQLAELFGIDKSGISRHIKNIYQTGELPEEATVAKFATVQNEGNRTVKRELEYYNLDMIISVGYRVKSQIATRFRIWATQRLKEYLIKGFTMDDDRLKQTGDGNYFEELLARIRDIRSSEKVFWRKVLDIYATSIDYHPSSDVSKDFFKQIQNKMHWAAHGQTAAEVIYNRVDAHQDNMGLTNWSGSIIRKNETTIGKNYLSQAELDLLNRIVTAYLELAEIQALIRTPMYMKDWVERLNQFLIMTGRELLDHAGKVSHEEALKKAQLEYEKFKQKRLNEPTTIEKHFIEAEKGLKKLIKTNLKKK
jgi:hypothetical protein